MPYPLGTKIGAPLTNGDAQATFGTHIDYLGVGGFRSVTSITDRDAIPVKAIIEYDGIGSGQRREGMVVYCSDTKKTYQLQISNYTGLSDADKLTNLANNSNWKAIEFGVVVDGEYIKDITFDDVAHTLTIVTNVTTRVITINGKVENQNSLTPASNIVAPTVDAVNAGLAVVQVSVDGVNTRIDTLVNGAPQALDTLKEIANQIAADEAGVAAILATQQNHTQQLAGKADDTNVVHKTGNESIAGTKTFNDGASFTNGIGSSYIYTGGISATNTIYKVYSENASLQLQSRDGDISIGTGNSQEHIPNLTVKNSGKVGIGTINPTEKLEVNGNVKAVAFIGDGSQLTNLPAAGVNKAYVDGADAGLSNRITTNTNNIATNTNNITSVQTSITKINTSIRIGTAPNQSQAPVIIGGLNNVVTGLESAAIAGGRLDVYGSDSAAVAGHQITIFGSASASASLGGGYSHIRGNYSAQVGGYGCFNSGNYSAMIGGTGLTMELGTDYSAIIGGRSFTAPVLTDMVFMPQVYLFKSGGGVSLLSANGIVRKVLTVGNDGKIKVDGVDLTGGAAAADVNKAYVDAADTSLSNRITNNTNDISLKQDKPTDSNTFFGLNSGSNSEADYENSFFGVNSGFNNTEGGVNSFFGSNSGYANTTGNENNFIGYNSGSSSTTGSGNSFIGTGSGANNTTGNYNTSLGIMSGVATGALEKTTAIGFNANATVSNTVIIGDAADTANRVGIGTSTPSSKLTVAGTIESTTGGFKFPDGTVQTTAGGGVSVINRTTTTVTFERDAEYNPVFSGTFTVSDTGKIVGAVVCIYLAPSATEPVIPTTGYKLIGGTYAAGKNLMYMFKVGANNQIQYTITNVD